MSKFDFIYYSSTSLMLICGLVAMYEIIKGRDSILHITMEFWGIEILAGFLFLKNYHLIMVLNEYFFYTLTIFWLLETSLLRYKHKAILIFCSSFFLVISILSFCNKLSIHYELPLVMNYFLISLIHLFNLNHRNIISKKSIVSHYLAFFSFCAYNIVSGLFYALRCFESANAFTYLYINFYILALCSICWTIALLLPPSPSSDQ